MDHSIPATAVSQNTPTPLGHASYAFTIARRKLQPGQAGTRKLLAEYGDRLVCVRYRYDAANKRRIKTVELAVEETPWDPPVPQIPLTQIMHVRINYDEIALRTLVKAAGGQWNRDQRAWALPYQEAQRLGLVGRIVDGQHKPQTARGQHETA